MSVATLHEFVFSVDVADESRFDVMLVNVADGLVRHAGCRPDAAGGILDGLHHALREGVAAGHHHCRVEFRAANQQLQVVVFYAGGREWRATHALP